MENHFKTHVSKVVGSGNAVTIETKRGIITMAANNTEDNQLIEAFMEASKRVDYDVLLAKLNSL